VLIGKHSLPTLRENCRGQYGTYIDSYNIYATKKQQRKIIFTISPTVVADLTRLFYLDRKEIRNQNTMDKNDRDLISKWAAHVFCKLATFLHQQLGADCVIDGQVVGDLSLLESACEFVHRYRTTVAMSCASSNAVSERGIVDLPILAKPWNMNKMITPNSIAVSATETRYVNTKREEGVESPAPTPSATETMHHEPGRVNADSYDDFNTLPMLASSCPGFVCFVEKTAPHCIPFLTTAKSAMSISGFLAKHIFVPHTVSINEKSDAATDDDDQCSTSSSICYHVAIMPCHDKKLEATRKDMAWEQLMTMSPIPDVDLVITTSELVDLIQAVGCAASESMRQEDGSEAEEELPFDIASYFDSLPTAVIVQRGSMNNIGTEVNLDRDSASASMHKLFTILETTESIKEERTTFSVLANTNSMSNVLSWNATTQTALSGSSGSYADFIFRFAALELFGFSIPADEILPWRNVRKINRAPSSSQDYASTSNRQSARGRRSLATNANLDFREIVLYKSCNDETYSLNQVSDDYESDDNHIPVLKFATAYGFKNIQSIVQKMKNSNSRDRLSTSMAKINDGCCDYHYIEVMACPSGCLNGGGQVGKLHSSGDVGPIRKETPTEKRDRLWKNHLVLDSRATQSHIENPLIGLMFPSIVSNRKDQQSQNINTSITEKAVVESSNLRLYRPPIPPFVSGPFHKESHRVFHTRFHSVPKLQLSVGAVSGVALSDTKW
jgi:iron only hydrogenase large subunit-like protein